MLQDSYVSGGVTWNKVPRNAQPVNVTYDLERTSFPVFQYNKSGDVQIHLSIHSGFAGVITNVHYTNGNYNNAKIHYNVKKKEGTHAGYAVDWAQVNQAGKKGFSAAMPAMQRELADFLVTSQIDVTAIQNMALKDNNYKSAEAFGNKPANWGKGRQGKRGVTFVISG